MSIELTEKAASEVLSIIKQQQEQNADGEAKPMFLRVGVKGGGCSGFSYTLDVTENSGEEDDRWSMHGVEVICDSRSLMYLKGTVVDFKDGLMGRGFVFSNPNATSSCGCGSSFSA